ncbi:MAG: choice-of-anchor D domain-containing protein [Candidatus Acidiferrales bacterium]
MKTHQTTQLHRNHAPASKQGSKQRNLKTVFTWIGAIASILAVISLSSCAGLTSAHSQGDPAGSGGGILTPSAMVINFGTVTVGNKSTQTLSVTNTGTASVNIDSASISGAGFTAVGGPLSVIGVGQSGTFHVEFTPTAAGAVTGTLTVASDAGNSPLMISLNGTGTQAGGPELSANPPGATFGNVVLGNSNSQTISLSNGGNASVTITQANMTGTGFSTTGLSTPTTIAAGGSTTFNAVFTPAATGAVTGSLTLVSNSLTSPLTINMSGTGLSATHLLGANPTSLPFGNVNDGGTSSLNVTLKNNGNSNITISGVTVTGTGYSGNGVSSGLTLTPNQTATLSVTFAPTTAGASNGGVSIASNATNSPAAVSLTGTGVAQSTHSVGLDWDASASTGVTGYFVYRGTTNGGPYTKQNPTQVATLQYTDNSVAAGQEYFYVVTAIDSSDVESAFSNQVSATIP